MCVALNGLSIPCEPGINRRKVGQAHGLQAKYGKQMGYSQSMASKLVTRKVGQANGLAADWSDGPGGWIT